MSDTSLSFRAAIEAANADSPGELLELVYDELRQMAERRLKNEPPGQTLQATALVHEAYLRLMGPAERESPERESPDRESPEWENRGHFFAAAAEAMRRILVERARARRTDKRGGAYERLDLDVSAFAVGEVPPELLDLDEALERLAGEAPQKAELVKLRFFAGLTLAQAAEVLEISSTTADRHWAYARAWLLAAMRGGV